MPQELVDILTVLALFFVRVGIPVLITLGLGYWLERKFRPAEDRGIFDPAEDRAPFAPLQGSTRIFDPGEDRVPSASLQGSTRIFDPAEDRVPLDPAEDRGASSAGSTRIFDPTEDRGISDPAEEHKPAKKQAVRAALTAKGIGLHCWDVQRCDSAHRAACAAYEHPDLPCWLALQVTGGKVREACFTCALFKPHSIAA